MADQQIVYRLRGDTSSLEDASSRADAALAAVERTLGDLASQLGNTAAASAKLEISQTSSVAALQSTVQWERALLNVRASAQNQQRQQYQTQQQFLAGLRSEADGIGKLRSELLALEAAELGVSAQAEPMIARLAQAERGAAGLGKTGKLTAFEAQQLGYQMNDLAVQIASGQSAFTAMIQQGSQLSGTFGGVGGAMRAVLTVITPLNVALTAGAAVVGLVGYAMYEGHQQALEYQKSMVLTGNAAGVTAGRVDLMAISVAQNARITAGAAREILQAFVSTGEVGPTALASVAEAAGRLQRITGTATSEIVRDFSSMSQGVAKWALEHNKQYNFLSVAQYKYIQSLEGQGRAEEAARVASEALNKALKDREPQLGTLARLWNEARSAAAGYFDRVARAGAPDNVDRAFERTQTNIARLQAQIERNKPLLATREGKLNDAALRAQLAVEQAKLAAVQRSQGLAAQVSQATAERTRQEQEDLERQSRTYQDSLLAIDKAGSDRLLAQQEGALEIRASRAQLAYETGEGTARAYSDALIALEQGRLDQQEANVERSIEIERRRVIEGTKVQQEEQRNQQQAAIEGLNQQLDRIRAKKVQLTVDIRLGKFDVAPKDSLVPTDALRQFESAQRAGIEQYTRDQAVARQQAAHDLIETTRDINIALIRDDEQRGRRQIAVDEDVLRKRLDLASMNAADRQRVEEDLAAWRAARERQLTEELKPEYQRQLELFADTQRYMKQASAEFHQSFIDAGRDAWTELLETGKISASRLGKVVADEFAKVTYDKLFAKQVSGAADWLFGQISQLAGLGGAGGAVGATQSQVRAVDNAIDAGNQAAAAAEQTAAQAALAESAGFTGLALDAVTDSLLAQEAPLDLLAINAQAAAEALAAVTASGGGSGGGGLLGSLFGDGGGSDEELALLEEFAARNGATFDGSIAAFARGGSFTNTVVHEPTLFQFARGTKIGQMGEEGPEAIVPLTRGPSGVLGIKQWGGNGGGAPNVSVNVEVVNNFGPDAKARVEQKPNGDLRVIFEQVEDHLASRMGAGQGPLAKATGSRFGLNPVAGAPVRGRTF